MKKRTLCLSGALCVFPMLVVVLIIGATTATAQLTYTTGLDVWLDAADIDGSANSTLTSGDPVLSWLNKGTTGVNNSAPPTGSGAGTYLPGAGPGGIDVVTLNNTRYQFGQEFTDSPNITMYFSVYRNSLTSSASSSLITDYGSSGNELLTIRAGNSVSGARDASANAMWVNDTMVQANNEWATLFLEIDATGKKATYGELGNLSSTPNPSYISTTTFDGTFGGPATLFSFHNGDDTHDFNGFVSEVLIYDHVLDASAKSQVESYLANKTGPGTFTPEAVIDRDTGAITITNTGMKADSIIGYSFTSAVGALDQSNWNSIANNGDVDSGAMNIDPDDKWIVLTEAGVHTDLSEAQLGGTGLGDGVVLGAGNSLILGDAWIQTPTEDVMLELLLPTGAVVIPVAFTGNNDHAFLVGDLNFQDDVTAADWILFRDNFQGNLSGFSPLESYSLGDMDGDGDNDWDDFGLFQSAYNMANGAGSFELMVSRVVPEPQSLLLLALIAPAALMFRRGKQRRLRGQENQSPHQEFIETNTMQNSNPAYLCSIVAATVLTGCLASSTSANTFDVTTTTFGKTITVVEAEQNYTSGQGPANPIALGLNTVPFDGIDRQIGFDGDVGWTSSTQWGGRSSWTAGGLLADGIWHADHNNLHGNNAPRITTTISGLDAALYEVYVVYVSDLRVNGGGMIMARLHDPTDTAPMATYGSEINTLGLIRGEDTGIAAVTGFNIEVASLGIVENATSLSIDIDNDSRVVGLASRNLYVGIGYRVLPQLTLEINMTNGNLTLANRSGSAIEIEGYEITSAAGSLNFGNWSSLQDQDYEKSGAPGDGMGFEELGTPKTTSMSEAILTTTYTFADQEAVSLGNVFNLSTQDLALRFRGPDGTFFPGLIQEVTTPIVSGDYNQDGVVNLADYTVWRDNLGGSSLPNEGGISPGIVDAADYSFWKSRFGAMSGSIGTATVPEPSTLAMMLATCSGLALTIGRRKQGSKANRLGSAQLRIAVFSIVAWAVAGSAALATVFNDREYNMGDDGDSPAAVVGSTVGITWDNAGTLGADDLLDLEDFVGNPSYVDVSGRPQANGSTLGIAFDGDDAFYGFPVNRPDVMKSIVDAESDPARDFPNNYTGILGHGLQMWVRPSAAALGSVGTPTTFQSIVADTEDSGGPAINAIGQWTQTNSNHADGTDGQTAIPASVSVPAGDAWYHVMHHHQPTSGNVFASIVYVDGVAVSANLDTIPTDSAFALAIGARQVSGTRAAPEFGNYFTGVVDDLEMYVFGDNTSQGGTNWGTFNLFADNEWIKNAIDTDSNLMGTLQTGDVNRDGMVSGDGTGDALSDDVAAFVAGWLSENRIIGAHGSIAVGDWNTWGQGDLNLDGRTTLADALILHNALLTNGSAGLDFGLLAGGPAVPEPAAFVLLAIAMTGFLCSRRWMWNLALVPLVRNDN